MPKTSKTKTKTTRRYRRTKEKPAGEPEDPRKPGRPSKLTPDRVDRLVQSLENGNTRTAAAGYAGLAYHTLLNWIERGEEGKPGDEEYVNFLDRVLCAESEAENFYVATIHNQSPEDWRAAAWYLERRRHGDYRKRESHEISGPEGGPIPLVWSDD